MLAVFYNIISRNEEFDMMNWWDYILIGISALCTLFSIVAAVKSNKYYKQSKQLTIYANTNIAYIESQKIIATLTSMIKFENPLRTKRGANPLKLASENAELIKNSLNKVRQSSTVEDYHLIQKLLNSKETNVELYIDSIIKGSAFPDGNIIWKDDFYACQQIFNDMQIQIKRSLDNIQERLK